MLSIFDTLGQTFLIGFINGLGMVAAFGTVWLLWHGAKRNLTR